MNFANMTASELGVMIAAVTCCSIGVLLAIAILCFNIRFKNLRFIKMTSPRVNIILILGTILLYACSLLMAIPMSSLNTNVQSSLFQSQQWLLALGLSLTFGSMLMKGWRVNRLFQYPRSHSLTIKDSRLFGAIFVLVLIDVSILLSWQFVDPVTCRENSSTNSIGSVSCTARYYNIWALVLLIYKYLLMAACCFIGWQIRHITFPALDDSRCLLLGSAITLSLIGAVAAVVGLFPSEPSATYSVTSILLWLGTTAILITIFLPKVLVVYRAQGNEPLLCSASKYVQQPVSSDVGTELLKILGENRYLKSKLEEKDTLISHLKKQLSTSLNIECVSQQTSSGNFSLPSGASSTSSQDSHHIEPTPLASRCFPLLCCETSADSMKAQRSSPLDSSQVQVLDVLTAPSIDNECHTLQPIQRCRSMSSYGLDIGTSTMPSITVSHVVPSSDCNASVSTENLQKETVNIQKDVWLNKHNLSSPKSKSSYTPQVNEDIDLICSIADTYDLGGDSDTYSFISNCLYKDIALSNTSYTAKRRHQKRRLSMNQTSSTLGSDQLYPDSLKIPSTKGKRHQMRRQSHSITTTNVYTNSNGKPLIF